MTVYDSKPEFTIFRNTVKFINSCLILRRSAVKYGLTEFNHYECDDNKYPGIMKFIQRESELKPLSSCSLHFI